MANRVNPISLGQIARELGVSLHRVEYIVKSRRLSPIGRAGNIRLFQPSDVQLISKELKQVAARKEVRHG